MQDTLHALADPTRREILNLLKQSRLSAGEISNHFSISGAAISRHLSVLKDADLIRNEREGKFIYYELNATVLEEILLWISELKVQLINVNSKMRKNLFYFLTKKGRTFPLVKISFFERY